MNSTVWHQYAEDIRNGSISSCKRLGEAIERYFKHLHSPVYKFDKEAVERVIAFSVTTDPKLTHCANLSATTYGKISKKNAYKRQ